MFRSITWVCLILAFSLIVTAAYVRLNQAGLACPDWPLCYGNAVVTDNAEFIEQANIAFPDNPVDMGKVWKQISYRYVFLSYCFFVVLLLLFSVREKNYRCAAITSSLILLLLAGIQAILALQAIELKLMPIVVSGQYLTGFLSFGLIFWLFLRSKKGVSRTHSSNGISLVLILITALVLFAETISGSWLTANNASLACVEFPKCKGSWWPQANYSQALDFFDGLQTGYRGVFSYDSQLAINWLHRVGAVIFFLLLCLLVFSVTASSKPKPVRNAGLLMAMLFLAQISLGIAIVKLNLPVWAALLHSGVAAVLMLPLIQIAFYRRFSEPGISVGDSLTDNLANSDALASGFPATIDVPAEPAEDVYQELEPESLYLRLRSQLQKTRTGLGSALTGLGLKQKAIDADFLEDIESALIMADIGIDATQDIITKLTERVEHSQLNDADALSGALKQLLLEILEPCNQPLTIPNQESPFVILVVGINGAGKTTTIGKLAKRLQAQGKTVMLAAGDTFRAAAVEQLQTWGERNNIHVVAQHTGADSASVIYDGVQSAQAKGVDVLIADTAGRLHTKSNLMDELKKVKRIMTKIDENAPHEVLLVLDAGTGQNALSQTRQFNETVSLTGIALTKLDGTAKGGVIFALAKQFGLPIRYIGVGEGIDDLQDFNAQQFVDALFASDS